MKYLLSMFFLISSFAIADEQEIDPEATKRINEINKYESIEGVWEGTYTVKSADPQLFDVLKRDGVLESGIGVKVILKDNNTPRVFYKSTAKSDW